MKRIYTIVKSPIGSKIIDGLMGIRALLFVGSRHLCPCCRASLRTFTHGGFSFKPKPKGYCPRCNSKPRHRWLWQYLQLNHSELFSSKLIMLHISPSHGLAYSFNKLTNLRYISSELGYRPNIHSRMDLTTSPFKSNAFDIIICIHVLEHIQQDSSAIEELFRMLKPRGWAMIAVPIRMGTPTFEDSSIKTPEARKKYFGEKDHVRFYGGDLQNRLQQVGFQIKTFYANDLDKKLIEKYGLKAEEVMFQCTKPCHNTTPKKD